ncbi:DUF6221 family protein [Streptomyces sp. JV176]|uniref:DUF6221 family protein n=1 Tax=Streptomyces sp. JV176 TaxID=858630 RepID=UPI002E79B600|nr:DUF6221 family protein [Streptomyces sp. JV176]MEE1802266.1 DUF6221 family protein [Streptomyces sp. JV176]
MTPTTDLIAFARARLDDDEEVALRCDGDGCGIWTAAGDSLDFCQVEMGGFHPAIATHVARHDPARVLREIQAHRTTVDEYEIALWAQADADQAACWQARRDTLLESCLRIATVYADHPEYRVEWSGGVASDLP